MQLVFAMINVMRKKYLVISPNGYGNIGDDICAYAGKEAIRQADPNAEVRITSPPMDEKLVDWADYVILSGGGIIYDRAEKNLENYLQYIDVAVEKGKKAAVLGVGVQGIVTEHGKQRYRESLEKCEFVSVRTKKDKEMLDEIDFKNAQATFDIAFMTPYYVGDITPQHNWLQKRTVKRLRNTLEASTRPKIGICMINLKMLKRDNYEGVFSKFDEVMAEFIAEAGEHFDVFMIQHAKEDGQQMRQIAKQNKIPFVPYRDINDLPLTYDVYSELDLMIGVRLHSIALGIMTETPTIAIGSLHAKQKRLIDYALPSLKKQFYDFTDVERLEKDLKTILKTKKIAQKPASNADMKKIDALKFKNVELIKKMIS